METKKHNSGFTLLEMSIVLAIIAVCLGSGILLFNEYIKTSKIEETKTKMQEILKSIKHYVDKYERLPCPAPPTAKISAASFGIENCSSADIIESPDVSNKVKMGAVPISTLNLFPTLALDGYGNRITYIVRENATATAGINSTDIDLEVTNYAGGSLYSDVVVILISHGENGYGAWNGASGVRLAVSGTDQEQKNTDPDTAFYISAPVARYDDIVYFRTKTQLTDEDFE